MKKTKILIIGSGGHAKSCIELLESTNRFKIVGLIDSNKNKKIYHYKVISDDNNISKIKKISRNLIIGLGSIGNISKRVKIFEKYKKLGFNFPIVISKNAIISNKTKIGEGTVIFNHVIINAGSIIGKNCLINNKSLIEHDVEICDHSHISTNVTVNGNCKINEQTFIGSGSVLKNNITLSKKNFIKMGRVIKKNQ